MSFVRVKATCLGDAGFRIEILCKIDPSAKVVPDEEWHGYVQGPSKFFPFVLQEDASQINYGSDVSGGMQYIASTNLGQREIKEENKFSVFEADGGEDVYRITKIDRLDSR